MKVLVACTVISLDDVLYCKIVLLVAICLIGAIYKAFVFKVAKLLPVAFIYILF